MKTLLSNLALPLLFICISSIGSAQDGPALSQLTEQQKLSFPDIQRAIVAMTGYENSAIEVSTTGHQLVVTLVNGKLGDAQSSARESEAAAIVSTVTNAIASKNEFMTVSSIRIDYIRRQTRDSHSHLEDSIEFRRGKDGTFRRHVS